MWSKKHHSASSSSTRLNTSDARQPIFALSRDQNEYSGARVSGEGSLAWNEIDHHFTASRPSTILVMSVNSYGLNFLWLCFCAMTEFNPTKYVQPRGMASMTEFDPTNDY